MSHELDISRRMFLTGASALAVTVALPWTSHAWAQQSAAGSETIFASIRKDIFGDRPLVEDSGVVLIEAPKRAQDAAIVPVDIHLKPGAGTIKALTMIIDVNPSPVVARFSFGEERA